ncbi:glycoside hydrolase family 18 protein [Trichoderma austrokoningii]
MDGRYRPIRLRYALLLPFLLALGFLTFHARVIDHIKQVVGSFQVSTSNEAYINSPFDRLPLKRANSGYTCNANKACSNGACCGSYQGTSEGVCGYGISCTSNCNAAAQCGEFAPKGSEFCPLNVCCSQFGFYGTGHDFCSGKCQSNCVQKPAVPPGRNSGSVLNKTRRSNARSCYAFSPQRNSNQGAYTRQLCICLHRSKDIQDCHYGVRYAEFPFTQTTGLRMLNSDADDVEIFVSIGGWTFSDNSTATQPVFSDIAASEANRNTFAKNLVNFLREYGFDGVDFDWEYPGAPDRRGKKEDTENYVLLLRAVREAFDSSGGRYGISFTAPSSFWYLQWFDLPRMMEYADWINLMTYDLHGAWDSSDAIGSIVQAHTNLTEIKSAIDLLWRMNIPPKKVVLGLGFYGRSFKLTHPSCASPGCPFSGAATPGICSKNAGTLAYFEIVDILDKQKPKVTWDKTDAVKYFQFGAAKDQWVSYDDEDTFAQKVEYANSIGLGGVLIWSVDQDTTNSDALRGLVGKDVAGITKHTHASKSVAGSWASQNGQKCVETDCLSDSEIGSWGTDFSIAPNGNAFPDNCGSNKNRYIICSTNAMPSTCQWRGGESTKLCHGQCHAGEVTLFHSKHATVHCLAPGLQAFCCQSNTWNALVDSYSWSSDTTCPSSKTWVAQKNVITEERQLVDVDFVVTPVAYCCDSGFDDCHWIGKGTCDQNECADYEIELALDSVGNSTGGCANGLNNRQKVLCCTPPQKLNPFLPVPLANLFPTLPPASYVPDFHIESLQNSSISSGLDTVTGAFGMVVIDGPPNVVTSLTARDDSHIQFLDCEPSEKRDAKSVYTARYICMDNSLQSNCDAVHEGGAVGTIVKLPEGCGFATYGVVKDIRPSANLTVEQELQKRAPSFNPPVYEMDISYDYSLIKRDSGTVYHYLVLEQLDFSQLLFSQNQSASCGEKDGFMLIELEGSVKSNIRFGVTMVGTISPEINFEETYRFFDADMTYWGTLMLNGKASVDIDGSTRFMPVFATDISNYAFSEPGIVSLAPKMNIQASLMGQGQIDSDFVLSFRGGTDGYARSNEPLSLGDPKGNVANVVGPESWSGFAGGAPNKGLAKRGTESTLLGVYLDMQTWLDIDVFGFGTNQEAADGQFLIDVPHYIRVTSDGGNISVISADQQVGIEAYSTGISSLWEADDSSHLVGSIGKPYVYTSGLSTPAPPRTAPNWGTESVVEVDYFGCSDNVTITLTCYSGTEMAQFDPDLNGDPEDGLPIAYKRSFELDPRNTGGRREFHVHTPSGYTFIIRSHSYPNGRNGAYLVGVNTQAGYYNLANVANCSDVTVTSSGSQNSDYVTEHIVELGTFGLMLEWMMLGSFTLPNGSVVRSRYTPIPEALLDTRGLFQTAWNRWPSSRIASTSTPMDDIWTAFGDTTNPGVLVNCEARFNSVKMQIWQGHSPMSNDTWKTKNFDDTSEKNGKAAAEVGISTIRMAISIFSYLNDQVINDNMAAIFDSMYATFTQFDEEVGRRGTNINTADMFAEFVYYILIPRLEGVQTWAETRIERMRRNWEAIQSSPMSTARAAIVNGSKRLQSEKRDKVEDIGR